MQAWRELPETEESQVWDRFDRRFDFDPRRRPAIMEPAPSTTYAIGRIYSPDQSRRHSLEVDLNLKTLDALRQCTGRQERLYALDWQHPCYSLYPHCPFAAEDVDAWKVPVLPDGDYYIFLAEDFRFGLIGHPWEQTICVFGQELLDAFALALPLIFDTVIRKNGASADSV